MPCNTLKHVLLTQKPQVCATVLVYGFGIFLPLIVQGMGYKGVHANLISVSPFLVGTIGLYTIMYLLDYF
jgi:hypothetical protein